MGFGNQTILYLERKGLRKKDYHENDFQHQQYKNSRGKLFHRQGDQLFYVDYVEGRIQSIIKESKERNGQTWDNLKLTLYDHAGTYIINIPFDLPVTRALLSKLNSLYPIPGQFVQIRFFAGKNDLTEDQLAEENPWLYSVRNQVSTGSEILYTERIPKKEEFPPIWLNIRRQFDDFNEGETNGHFEHPDEFNPEQYEQEKQQGHFEKFSDD